MSARDDCPGIPDPRFYRAGWSDGWKRLPTSIAITTERELAWYQAGYDDGTQRRRDL